MLWAGLRPSAGRSTGHAEDPAAQKSSSRRPRRRPRSATAPTGCRARRRTCARRSWAPSGPGRIEELRHAWELNELKPDLGVAARRRRPDRALEADLGRRRGPGDPGGAGRDPRRRLRGAAARPRSREQPDLRVALLRRGGARQAQPRPGGASCCASCRPPPSRRCGRPANTPIGASASAPTARGILSAGGRESRRRGNDSTYCPVQALGNLLYMQTCKTWVGGWDTAGCKGRLDHVARWTGGRCVAD